MNETMPANLELINTVLDTITARNPVAITQEKVLHVLKTGENEVHLSEELRTDSRKPLEKMLELAK